MSVAQEQLKFIDDIMTETILKYNELKRQKVYLEGQMQDLYHVIEFSTFNVVDGYKLAKMLKDIRVQRREVKDEIDLLNPIIVRYDINRLNEATKHVNIASTKLDNRKYEFRSFKKSDSEYIVKLMKDSNYKMKN